MSEMNVSKKVMVKFDNTNEIKDFVNLLAGCSASAEFVTTQQKVDATSLMGIFTLNVLEPLQLKIKAVNEEKLSETLEKIGKFLVAE